MQQAIIGLSQCWDGAHQTYGIGVQRLLDDLADGADFGDPACIEHSHAVSGFGDDAHVVGDQHDGGATVRTETLQHIDNLRLHGNIQRGRWFICDDKLRLRRQR